MTGPDIRAFLEARLTEDQALIERNTDGRGLDDGFPDYRTYDDTRAADDYINRFGPARALAEVAAKRRVLERHHPAAQPNYRFGGTGPIIYTCEGCGYDTRSPRSATTGATPPAPKPKATKRAPALSSAPPPP